MIFVAQASKTHLVVGSALRLPRLNINYVLFVVIDEGALEFELGGIRDDTRLVDRPDVNRENVSDRISARSAETRLMQPARSKEMLPATVFQFDIEFAGAAIISKFDLRRLHRENILHLAGGVLFLGKIDAPNNPVGVEHRERRRRAKKSREQDDKMRFVHATDSFRGAESTAETLHRPDDRTSV